MGRRALVTEDDELLSEVLADYLAELGLTVHCAHEREEAEALLANVHYNLLITDISLSSEFTSEGFDVLAAARYAATKPKVIVLSGHPVASYGSEALRRGADAFLTKPVSLERLRDVVLTLLNRDGGGRAPEPVQSCLGK